MTIHILEKIEKFLIGIGLEFPGRILDYIWDWQVGLWWITISLVSLLNLYLWKRTYHWVVLTSGSVSPDESRFFKLQLFLSFIYVSVCAFRSFIPRADVQKIVIWDSYLSSVFVGRSVATIAELCFAFQISYFLEYISGKYRSQGIALLSKLIFPLLFVAEFFSWYSVITTNYIGNTIEESLWCFSGFLLMLASLILIVRTDGLQRLYYLGMSILAGSFVSFMLIVDIPMYYKRYMDDTILGKVYFDFKSGFYYINNYWYVTHSYKDWNGELAWMFFYFTFAVWVSLHMIKTPAFLRELDNQEEKISIFRYLNKNRVNSTEP